MTTPSPTTNEKSPREYRDVRECAFFALRAAHTVTEINFRKHYWHGRQVLLGPFRQSRVISGRNRLERLAAGTISGYKLGLRSGMQLLRSVSRDCTLLTRAERPGEPARLAEIRDVCLSNFYFARPRGRESRNDSVGISARCPWAKVGNCYRIRFCFFSLNFSTNCYTFLTIYKIPLPRVLPRTFCVTKARTVSGTIFREAVT